MCALDELNSLDAGIVEKYDIYFIHRNAPGVDEMTVSQAITYEETEFFFVVLGTKEAPMPMQIDSVMLGSDGSRVGRFGGQTLEQIANHYKRTAVEMDWEVLREQQEKCLRTEPEEITEAQWYEALEVLPPMHWGKWLGVESFCMCEFYSGNMTNIYARLNGKFWRFMDDAYMGGEAIARKVAAAAQAAPLEKVA